MEIFGINLNEFKMVKGSLEVKMTIRKIFLIKFHLAKIVLSENHPK